MRIEFENPILLLLIPVIIVGLILSVRLLRGRETRFKVQTVIIRAIIFSLLVGALSGVTLLMGSNKTATIFVVDTSDSVKNNSDEIVEFVNEAIKLKGKDDYVGIVSFGRNAAVECFLTDKLAFSGVNSIVDREGTNLQEAVDVALSMIDDEVVGRIVIVSDGAETTGNLSDVAVQCLQKGCEIRYKKINQAVGDEVYVSDVSLPEKVGTGDYFNVNVEVVSNVRTQATVSLYSGRVLKGQQQVMLQKGVNSFVFHDTVMDSGLNIYKVTVEAENDGLHVNNEYSAYTKSNLKKPVLVVTGSNAEPNAFFSTLEGINVQYKTCSATFAPSTINNLLEYSAVITVNVDAADLPEGFMNSIETYVKDYGRGFIATGGPNSFGMGSYKETVLEKILPVDMEPEGEEIIPESTLIFLIDKSGSMSETVGGLTNLDSAKNAAVAAIKEMRSEDFVGVYAFDDKVQRVVPVTSLSERSHIIEKVKTIEIEGGTSIYPAVMAGVNDLIKSTSTIRHIILLTDGQDTYNNYNALINMMVENGITLSSVAVGTGPNVQLLSELATKTNGRMYSTIGGHDITKIFEREVLLTQNTYIRQQDFVPVVTSNSELITGVIKDGLPIMQGFIATKLKPSAVQYFESDDEAPILASQQYGLGKTVAFTSDVSGKWTGKYQGFAGYAELWHNLLQYVTGEVSISGAYADVRQEGDKAWVTYNTGNFGADTKITAIITDEQGETKEITLNPKNPGVYENSFELDKTGVFSIAVLQKEGEEVKGSFTTAAIRQYSDEYTFSDKSVLEGFAALTGGTEVAEPDQVFVKFLNRSRDMKKISVYVLIFALVLCIIDIALRRFRINLIPKKKEKVVKVSSTETSANIQKTGSKSDKKSEKTRKADDSKKKQEPAVDVIDTSALLKRMKK